MSFLSVRSETRNPHMVRYTRSMAHKLNLLRRHTMWSCRSGLVIFFGNGAMSTKREKSRRAADEEHVSKHERHPVETRLWRMDIFFSK